MERQNLKEKTWFNIFCFTIEEKMTFWQCVSESKMLKPRYFYSWVFLLIVFIFIFLSLPLARINRVCRFQLSLYFTKIDFWKKFHSEMFTTDSRHFDREGWICFRYATRWQHVKNSREKSHDSYTITFIHRRHEARVHYLIVESAFSTTQYVTCSCRNFSYAAKKNEKKHIWKWRQKNIVFSPETSRVFAYTIVRKFLSAAGINQTNKNPRTEKSINEVCLVNHVTAWS